MNHNDFFKLIAADGLRGAYLLQGEEEFVKASALKAAEKLIPEDFRLTLRRFDVWNSGGRGMPPPLHAKSIVRPAPHPVRLESDHLPPGEGIPQKGRYTSITSDRTPPSVMGFWPMTAQ